MAQNTFKIQSQQKRGLFSKLENLMRLDRLFEDGLPLKYLPYILFTTVLIIIYIGYHHYAEKTSREISKIEIEVEDLRADYTTLKAEYMYSRLQSEVVKKVDYLNLEEASEPPYKISVKESEY
jgi:hypothetical protein